MSTTCGQCAQQHCAANLGTAGCESSTLAGSYTAQVADSADGINVGDSISEQTACVNLVKCAVTQHCVNTSTLFLACYCDGLASNQTQCLSTLPATGGCAAQYDIGLSTNSTTAASLTNMRSTSYPAGEADMLLVCLSSQCSSCL